jgi:MtN3 and saliva related transmembrane protein
MSSELIGYIAGTLTTLAFLPQLITVWKRKSAKDLSWFYLFTFAVGISFWLTYGLMLSELPIILANVVTLALVLFIMFFKWKFHG